MNSNMKAVVKNAPVAGVEYLDVPIPVPKPDEVLIEVEAAAICGTDIHYNKWDQSAVNFSQKFNLKFPFVLGHECSGKIIAVGSEVKSKKVGQRVAFETHIPCGSCFMCQTGNAHNCMNMSIYGTSCDGCFAEYATAPESIVFELPDDVSYEEGALFEPAGVAMRAVELAQIEPGDTVVVYGCGPIGLITMQILKVCGAANIIAVDVSEYRLKMAKELGAITINGSKEDVVSVVSQITKAKGGADVVLEMTGAMKVYEIIFDLIRLEGRLVTVGHPAGDVSINITQNVNLKGVSIKGLFGRKIWDTWWHLSALVGANNINILDVVTHRFKFSECKEAFEQVDKGAGKILFVKG